MINEIKLNQCPETNFEILESFALNSAMSLFKTCPVESVYDSFHPALKENPALNKMSTAISMAFHLSDSILDGIFSQPTPHYAMHYNRVNSLLDDAALKITAIIQNSGFEAMPVPASQIIDKSSQKGYLNHKIVARAAGVGFIGRNNLLVTRQFGARVRLVTLLTNAPLKLCAPVEGGCGGCYECVSACPAGAIGETAGAFELAKCVEQISKFQRLMFVAKGICGVCLRACRKKTTI
jgi:epoxyqueuosine reductase QueG